MQYLRRCVRNVLRGLPPGTVAFARRLGGSSHARVRPLRYFIMVGVTPASEEADTWRLVLNVVMIFRLLRLLKLLAVFSPTKKIVWTLQRVAPSMGRLLFIILAVLYVFAIIGVETFPTAHGPKGFVDELTFRSFPAAMLTLFEVRRLPP